MGSSVSSATQSVACNRNVPWQMSCVRKPKCPLFPRNRPWQAKNLPTELLWKKLWNKNSLSIKMDHSRRLTPVRTCWWSRPYHSLLQESPFQSEIAPVSTPLQIQTASLLPLRSTWTRAWAHTNATVSSSLEESKECPRIILTGGTDILQLAPSP